MLLILPHFSTMITLLYYFSYILGIGGKQWDYRLGIYKDVGDLSSLSTDVIIIGGGATGAGIVRDCALRGIDCIFIGTSRYCDRSHQDVTTDYYTVVHVTP